MNVSERLHANLLDDHGSIIVFARDCPGLPAALPITHREVNGRSVPVDPAICIGDDRMPCADPLALHEIFADSDHLNHGSSG